MLGIGGESRLRGDFLDCFFSDLWALLFPQCLHISDFVGHICLSGSIGGRRHPSVIVCIQVVMGLCLDPGCSLRVVIVVDI